MLQNEDFLESDDDAAAARRRARPALSLHARIVTARVSQHRTLLLVGLETCVGGTRRPRTKNERLRSENQKRAFLLETLRERK